VLSLLLCFSVVVKKLFGQRSITTQDGMGEVLVVRSISESTN